ncbi:MAG: hypothetical protein CSA45_00210 [Gammaproteobacteria bacterium]|nr:MAG: hypothetical protein CSA45_00210 [Gammaproteobacteria bacterium]
MKKTVLLALLPVLLWAKDARLVQPNQVPDSDVLDKVKAQAAAPAIVDPIPAIAATKKSTAVEMDSQSLLANPALLKRAMHSVLVRQQIDGIAVILPIYRRLADADNVLITYAEALLAHSKGQLAIAINGYRQVIAKQPKMSAARLNLAMALYHNHQVMAARDQFVRLQNEKLPQPIANIIKQSIARIDRQEAWQFAVNFYYRQEDNINDVPEQQEITYGNNKWVFPEPKKAHGMHIALEAKKRFNLSDTLYSDLQFNANSDFFWDNHDYDDLSLRAGVGLGYQTATFNADIQPFVKKRFYGTNPYSLSTGANGHINYQLTPHWRLANYWEWSYEHFDNNKFLNGQRRFVSLSAVYIHNPQQYWTAGINYYDSGARGDDDSYYRKGAFASWGQEWPKGLSSNFVLSIGKRDHRGVGFPNIKRSDKEYSADLSLWHRGIHYRGITPRLVWSWEKTDSNHFLYNKKENKIHIEFSKTF